MMHDDVMDSLPHDFMLNLSNSIKLAERFKELEQMQEEKEEAQPQGLSVEMSQDSDFSMMVLYEDTRFVQGLGTWAPVVVSRQCEKDYLEALALMLGKDVKNWVSVLSTEPVVGIDTPPTWVRIPALLD